MKQLERTSPLSHPQRGAAKIGCIIGVVFVVILGIVAMSSISTYNGLVAGQEKVTAAWQEIDYKPSGAYTKVAAVEASSKPATFTVRQPMISSLRRNLQREHLERLIDLSLKEGNSPASWERARLSSKRAARDSKARRRRAPAGRTHHAANTRSRWVSEPAVHRDA